MSLRPWWSALGLVTLLACGGAPPPPPASVVVAVPPPSAVAVVAEAPAQVVFPGEDDAAVPISPRNPAWGSRAALVTIVEFADFQCPFSSRVQPTLTALRERYGPEDLRIVWKNEPLPFHTNARPAALAAEGVYQLGGPAAFWAFHDLAFGNQKDLGADAYERWAAQAGVRDLAALRAGLASDRWADAVDADLRESKELGATGTPGFFINGVQLSGAQPLEKFVAVVDQELARAKASLALGTPRELLYARLAREGRAHAPPPATTEDSEKEDTKTVFRVPVGSSPARGSSRALVTIVEFSDFQCPFCGRVQPTLAAIRARYGDKVRLVWKNEPLPFHPRAEPAAQAALEVRAELGDPGFWAMHDRLFAGQKDLADEAIVAMAKAAGASGAKVAAAMAAHKYARDLAADQALSDDVQATGTPHFFINGRRLVGAQPQEKFEAIIDEELARAGALVAKGTPPQDVYAALTKDGKGPTPPEMKDLPPMPAGDPSRGPAGARVVVHEWADFQCPFSARAQATLRELEKGYAGRIRLVWHDLPLPMHAQARLAAVAAREAYKQKGPAAFWTMHDTLFGAQQHLQRDALDGYARAMGLEMGRWGAALDGELHGAAIDADKTAADAVTISGTPGFLIAAAGARRAYFVSGAQPEAKFRRVIDRALGEAR